MWSTYLFPVAIQYIVLVSEKNRIQEALVLYLRVRLGFTWYRITDKGDKNRQNEKKDNNYVLTFITGIKEVGLNIKE